MFTTQNSAAGFTLMELLTALLLTSLLATGVAHFLTASNQVRLVMHQDTLAARTAEELATQLHISQALSSNLTAGQCRQTAQMASLDTTLLCKAYQQLPQLQARRQGQAIRLSWLGPTGPRSLTRPIH